MTDPSSELAEIKALVQHQITASEARNVEAVRDREATKGQLTEMRHTLSGVVSQVLAIDIRLGKNEELASEASQAARKALDSQTDLEGSLLAEVGALASNDKAQNAALTAIKAETHAQSKTLDAQTKTLDVLEKSETKRSAREDVIYWAITKGVPLLWAATVALVGAWFATHK